MIKFVALISAFIILVPIKVLSQKSLVESKVYEWKEISADNTPFAKHLILQGTTVNLKLLEVYGILLQSGEKSIQNPAPDTSETMILVKDGELEIQLLADRKTIGPGSMALILPGDTYSIKNVGSKSATYYQLKFNSKTTANKDRGINSGGSFVIDFSKQEFKPHDKGGIRNYYRDKATAMFGFTEMHVTTLNPQIKSHEPHKHSASEIVLMISGKSEMQIGDAIFKGSTGDLYYLESNVSHAIRNIGDTPCMYYAIQWE